MTIPPNARYTSVVDSDAPAADTAAAVTLAAVAGQRHVISKIDVSYIGTITTAGLTITGLDGEDYAIDLPATAGFYQVPFNPPLVGDVNTAVVVTALDPANAAGTAKLNVIHAR
jgi:hypothetical protein